MTSQRLRTKFIDFDARRSPKSDHFCIRCQKDMAPDQPCRWVHCINGGLFALHPDDESKYVYNGASDMGCYPIGLDCARKIGLEWTHVDAPGACARVGEEP